MTYNLDERRGRSNKKFREKRKGIKRESKKRKLSFWEKIKKELELKKRKRRIKRG